MRDKAYSVFQFQNHTKPGKKLSVWFQEGKFGGPAPSESWVEGIRFSRSEESGLSSPDALASGGASCVSQVWVGKLRDLFQVPSRIAVKILWSPADDPV